MDILIESMKKKDPSDTAHLLRQINIFSELNPGELEELIPFCEYIELESGALLFSEGDPGDALFIVESGEVVVRKADEYSEGPEIHLARYIPGSSFGELDLFCGEQRKADALASQETVVLRFPKKGMDLQDFFESQSLTAAQILHRLLVLVSDRIRRTNDLVKENSPLVQELKKQVYRDKLTGIYNQNYLTETLKDHIRKAGTPLTLLISKPDNFKELNDNYGHKAGDRAIRIMAKGLRDLIGDDNRTARYKGNAMAVILYGRDRQEAYATAQAIQTCISSLDLSPVIGSDPFNMTASVGIGIYPDISTDGENLIRLTHELPLEGRQRGGNRVLIYRKKEKQP